MKEHSDSVTPPSSSVGGEAESANITTRLLEFIKNEHLGCQIELEELKERVVRMGSRGSSRGGFEVDGKDVTDFAEASMILEKELPDGYILIGCFVTPHVLLEMVARHLYEDLQATIAVETKISAASLTTFDYWAGQAMQKAIPKFFNGTGGKSIPGAGYKHSAKGRFTAMPSFKDFGSDTDPCSAYKKILYALESTKICCRTISIILWARHLLG